ncbi:MAG TPA: hypothetical protein VGD33_05000, partial [Chitinophagaceae bacterium]
MNEYISYDNNGEEDIGLIPRGASPKNPKPPTVINEQAFYAASQYSNNPVEDYYTAQQEMSSNGSSELVDKANESWKQEQSLRDEDILKDLI